MSMRSIKRSIIRSQSENNADFRARWKRYHDQDMVNRKVVNTNRKPRYHYDDPKNTFAAWKRMKEYIQQIKANKAEEHPELQAV